MADTIYCDTSSVGEVLKKVEGILSPRTTNVAMAGALNKTLKFIGAETRREVNNEYYVVRSINKALTEKRATSSRLEAVAKYEDRPTPLFLFKHKAPPNQYRSPVSVIVKKSNGWQTHQGSNPAAFKAYKNKIKQRQPGEKNIHGVYSVSIPQMVANKDVYKSIAKKAEAELPKKLNQELTRRIEKL